MSGEQTETRTNSLERSASVCSRLLLFFVDSRKTASTLIYNVRLTLYVEYIYHLARAPSTRCHIFFFFLFFFCLSPPTHPSPFPHASRVNYLIIRYLNYLVSFSLVSLCIYVYLWCVYVYVCVCICVSICTCTD